MHVGYNYNGNNTFRQIFSKAKLKETLCKSTGTDKDFYLSQFVILTLLTEIYDGQGNSSKCKDYIRVGELQNSISEYLKTGVEQNSEEEEEQKGIAFRNMLEAYEALRSDDKGSKVRTTKEGFLHNIFVFLEKQGLIDYIEEDEMIKTTKKLDNLMDWNLLNQNHYQRSLHRPGLPDAASTQKYPQIRSIHRMYPKAFLHHRKHLQTVMPVFRMVRRNNGFHLAPALLLLHWHIKWFLPAQSYLYYQKFLLHMPLSCCSQVSASLSFHSLLPYRQKSSFYILP